MQRISFDILCQRRIHVTVDAKKKKSKRILYQTLFSLAGKFALIYRLKICKMLKSLSFISKILSS